MREYWRSFLLKFPFSIAIWNGEEEEKEEENPTQRRRKPTIPTRIVFRGRGEDQISVLFVKALTKEDLMLKL